jgi:hypothetical protein
MSDLKSFQDEHGEQWNAITQHPAFAAALSFLNLQKISRIASLTDEEIEKNGCLIVADLRGHLNHENDLFALGTKQNLNFQTVSETYPDPVSEMEISSDNSEPPKTEQPLPRKPRKKRP